MKRLTERAKKLVQQLATEKDIRISSEKLLQQAKKELQKKEAENVEQRLIIQHLQRNEKKKKSAKKFTNKLIFAAKFAISNRESNPKTNLKRNSARHVSGWDRN